MVETALLERKDLRDQTIERVEVLDKVKALFLIPRMEMMTARQVADYYEVDVDAIRRIYQRNRSEIDQDGTIQKTTSEFLAEHNVQAKSARGKKVVEFTGVRMDMPNNGTSRFFSKRAILRIGMLLRDSPIAREVRTQLLNTFEHASDSTRLADIDEEQRIQAELGRALMSENIEEIVKATGAAFAFKNRHIAALEQSNKLLAAEILAWSDRASINKAIRTLASRSKTGFGIVWKDLYDELQYKHGICLAKRGQPPLIQYVKEPEWPKVQKSFAAICQRCGYSPALIMEIAKMGGA